MTSDSRCGLRGDPVAPCGQTVRTRDSELASDELSPADSIEALSDALLDITGVPRVRFSNVKDIEVKRVGRWVTVTVKSKGDPNELTFRISRAWATALCARLKRAIEG